jgi:8-oxo-dGTP pyrophosphatase MutT (NUDIX family)
MESMEFFDRKGRAVTKPADRKVEKRISAYGMFIDSGRLLLISTHVHPGLWELPGGGLEPNESAIQGLKREFLEETGYVIEAVDDKPLARVESRFYAEDVDRFYNSECYFFRVKGAVRQGDFSDAQEINGLAWLERLQIGPNNIFAQHWGVIKVAMVL